MKVIVEHDGCLGVSEDKDATDLQDALGLCQQALYSVGFRFKGQLDIVEDEC